MDDSYVKLYRRFWNSRKVREVIAKYGRDTALVYVHLLTTPRGNHTGCFQAHPQDLADQTGMSKQTYMKHARHLRHEWLCWHDEAFDIWYITTALEQNPPDNHYALIRLIKYLKPLPESRLVGLAAQWLRWYADVKGWSRNKKFERFRSEWLPMLDSIEHSTRYPYTVSDTVYVNDSDNDTAYEESFERFWKAWPKRKGSKSKALKKWIKIAPDEEFAAHIIEAVKKQSKGKQWTEKNGQYIPHVTTWLNGKEWNNEVENSGRSY